MRKNIIRLLLVICILGVFPFLKFDDSPSVKAETVTICRKKVGINQGEVTWLYLNGTAKKGKWVSTNKKIVTVSKYGRIKGKSVGRAVVKATLNGQEFKCRVTVRKPKNKTVSQSTIAYDAGDYSITNIHKGEATYYNKTSGGTACLDYLEKAYYTVAMNKEDYLNGLAGAYILITDKDGDTIRAYVTDMLPEGKKGDIDLTKKAFKKLEPLATGRMDVTWKIVPNHTTRPISYAWNQNSSQYWAAVQVRNGRYPISKLEYLDTETGEYVELVRQNYNYFTAEEGKSMGAGPFTFRVTDFYGHELIDANISINNTGKPVDGKHNFPY